MALRVLLADESSTIKKVFQLSLQDFAVEVQAVDIGSDVVPVAKKFKPDIIFIDILLQKKNGYLVSAEIKADPQLKHLPVVLMWSGFLELDQDKFQVSQATDALEKPFDTAALRELIKTHVPKTGSQSLSQFLKFPKAPKVEGKQPSPDQLVELGGGPPTAPKKKKSIIEELSASEVVDLDTNVNTSTWNMDKFSSVDLKVPENTNDSFREMSIPKSAKMALPKEDSKPDLMADDSEQGGTGWVQQNIDRFRMNHINPEEVEGEIPIEFETPPSPHTNSQIRTFEPSSSSDIELEVDEVVAAAGPAPQKAAFNANIDEEKWEKILREEASKAIEAVVWKVIPELAERIIERELKRLLDEKEK